MKQVVWKTKNEKVFLTTSGIFIYLFIYTSSVLLSEFAQLVLILCLYKKDILKDIYNFALWRIFAECSTQPEQTELFFHVSLTAPAYCIFITVFYRLAAPTSASY